MEDEEAGEPTSGGHLMEFLSWNLGGNRRDPKLGRNALRIGCRHLCAVLARGEPLVAAFQECPATETELRAMLPGTYLHRGRQAKAGAHPRVLVSSKELREVTEWERTLVARIDHGGETLAIACYHGRDQISFRNPTARGGAASELRWMLDQYAQGGATLLLGDFNAEPGGHEVQNRWCFGFPTDGRAASQSHGRPRPPLRVVRARGSLGSFRLREPGQEERWALVDFVVASEDLATRISWEHPKELAATQLTNGNGFPKVSDHLPVVGSIHPPSTPTP